MSVLYCAEAITFSTEGNPICSPGWQSLSDTEFSALASVDVLTDLFDLLNSVFMTPETDAMQLAFLAGFSVPTIAYLVSANYGVVINWFK